MKAPAHRPQSREPILRFYHAAEWIVVAVIVAAAFAVQPELRQNLVFLAAAAVYLFSVLLLARMRWPIRNAEQRLLAGFLLSLLGMAAVLRYSGGLLNGLLVTFTFSTTAAWLLLPRSKALWVMALACTLCVGISLAGGLDVLNGIYAAGLCAICILTALLAEIAVRRAAAAEAKAAVANGRDELTGMPGRHAFLRHAELLHSRATLDKSAYAIEIVDIENLRSINDTYGYAAGDRAIVVVAQAIERLRAPDEQLARFEGDKFVVLVPRLDGARADELARRIRSVVFSTTIDVDTEVVRIKANVGVAKYPLAGVTVNALISAAERDMKLDQTGRAKPGKKPVFRRRSGKLSA